MSNKYRGIKILGLIAIAGLLNTPAFAQEAVRCQLQLVPWQFRHEGR